MQYEHELYFQSFKHDDQYYFQQQQQVPLIDDLSPHILVDSCIETITKPSNCNHVLEGMEEGRGEKKGDFMSSRTSIISGQISKNNKRSSNKDRHSKINTARGPRDRRTRLSLDAARKFFHLQDLLGFDKASKTVEWLLSAIEQLVAAKGNDAQITQQTSCNTPTTTTGIGAICASNSISESCEVISGTDETSSNDKNKETAQDEKKKRKKVVNTARRAVLEPLTKESRNQARARARERTKSKKMSQIGKSKAPDLNPSGSRRPANKTCEEPGTHEQLNFHQEKNSVDDCNFMVNGNWNPFTIFSYHEQYAGISNEMEEKVKEIVEFKQRSWAEEKQKTLEVLKEREQLLQDQLRQAQESVSTMQKLHELAQSQLFEVRAQSEEERAAKQSEFNLLMDEVERAQGRLVSLEREKGLLRSQLQTANEDNDHKNSDNLDADSALENSLYAKEKIISELNVELHKLENTLSNEREEHINEIKKLNSLLNEKEVALEELKKELQTRPTTKLIDDLRKKVKILQAVGYNSFEAEDWEVATSGQEMSKLESLLLDKNRKVEHELTQLKVQLSERISLLESAEAKVVELTAKVNEQQRLIQKLEDDILKGYSSKDRKGTRFDDWDLSESGATEPSENEEQRHVYSDQDQSSMLKVICNQRDRFRTRLRETEEEIRQLKEKIGSLTSELDKTKADNVKLYGKIRYVQDYNSERVISRGSKEYVENLEVGFSSDVESKYMKMYEDDINPFAAFSMKERDQRYKELGLRDKITLSSGRFLLDNKYAWTFVFFYTIVLHILVFTCLYTGCQR